MKTRDVVLITILSCGAVVAIVALAAYIYIRRRRRKRDDEDGTSCAIRADSSSTDGGGQKTSRLNGFLNLKTPLISTKTLGMFGPTVNDFLIASRDAALSTHPKDNEVTLTVFDPDKNVCGAAERMCQQLTTSS